MLLGIGSLSGAPGATTLACALAASWDTRRVLVLEADPWGGTLAARFALDPNDPTILGLAAASRHGLDEEAVWRHTQELPIGVPAVLAPTSPTEITRALREFVPRISEFRRELPEVDVIVDVGRIVPTGVSAQLVRALDGIVVCVHPTFEALQPLLYRLDEFTGVPVAVVAVGDGPYGPSEIDRVIRDRSSNAAWLVGAIPSDRRGAAAFNGAGGSARTLRRSSLVRSARQVGEALRSAVARIETSHQHEPEPLLDLTEPSDPDASELRS